MKKRRTNSILLLSTLTTMVLCTTAKACEIEDFIPPERYITEERFANPSTKEALRDFEDNNHTTTHVFNGQEDLFKTISKINPALKHQDLGLVLLLTKFLKPVTVFKGQYVKRYHTEEKHNQTLLTRFLIHLGSQEIFGTKDPDETD